VTHIRYRHLFGGIRHQSLPVRYNRVRYEIDAQTLTDIGGNLAHRRIEPAEIGPLLPYFSMPGSGRITTARGGPSLPTTRQPIRTSQKNRSLAMDSFQVGYPRQPDEYLPAGQILCSHTHGLGQIVRSDRLIEYVRHIKAACQFGKRVT
jgi:hypothetical protein